MNLRRIGLICAICGSLPALLGATGWPVTPRDIAHPLGGHWGDQLNFGTPYMHPGIDPFPDTIGQALYAVAHGWVKAWGTTQAEFHYRLAISDSPMARTTRTTGWLYAHVDVTRWHKSFGDEVNEGELIGYIVPWPVTGFDHVHFARISDTGATWARFPNLTWWFIQDPLTIITPVVDTTKPTFEDARTGYRFAFSRNNSAAYFRPDTLKGDVDIIAKIYDRINPYTSSPIWNRQVPQTLTYSIRGPYRSQDESLAVTFKYVLPQGAREDSAVYKQDATCRSWGDYNTRDYFFIVTNGDGDSVIEATDTSGTWLTTSFPDTSYWVKVTARDARGNSRSDSMQVTTANNIRNVGCTKIEAPAGTLDSGTSVTPACSVYNYGTTFATYNVRMKIGTSYNNTVAVTRQVPGQYLYVTFPAWTASLVGSIAVSCSTEYTSDIQSANDKRTGSVTVQRAPMHDVGCIAILAPVGTVDSGAPIIPRVTVRNFGVSPETVWVRFRIYSVYADSQAVVLTPGATATVSFANWIAGPPGMLATSCSTMLVGDQTPANDRVRDSVEVLPPTAVEEGKLTLPRTLMLENPVPNPFAQQVSVSYALPGAAHVNLSLYAANGRLVQTLFEGTQSAGYYSVRYAPRMPGKGIYYVRLQAGDRGLTRKLVKLE
jgi:hypothetical protein